VVIKQVPNKNRRVGNCNLCGMCNLNCPVYTVLLNEAASPRFKAFLAKKKEYKKVFFLCTNCGACIQDCPANIDVECLKIRANMVENGFETPISKVMRQNIRRSGNPFGEVKKSRKIKQYYT